MINKPVVFRGSLLWTLWMLLAGQISCSVNAATEPQKQVTPIDEIVAVVNDAVITRTELATRLNFVIQQLQKQGTQPPPDDILKKQMLERMIIDLLQNQYAKETGIRVDDTQLDKTLQRIAQENNFISLAELRSRLEKDGVNFRKFREEIRSEIIASRLREREIDSKLAVSDREIDNYLAMQSKMPGNADEYQLAHILVLVPEQASAEKIKTSLQRAENALAQLQNGAEFAQVAAGISDAKDALQGGNLGWRPADRVPTLFLGTLQKMQPGDVSPILRSSNGFHIFKLVDKRSNESPVVLTQSRARHILIKTSEIVPEVEAKARLLAIRKNITEGGADFAAQAKRFSDDPSAAQGGELGWISPGDTVPEFENAMNALKIGDVSDAIQTGFGWHLIQVLERRDADVSVEQKRQQARMTIRSFKSEEAYQDWLRQLRDRAYVEYRIKIAGGQQ